MRDIEPVFSERGVFIAFEGGDAAGKSTQQSLLVADLRSRGYDVVATREPGGTTVGERLRTVLLDPATGDLSPRTEALIYAADKAEHVDQVIAPALAANKVVITDRYVDSALAYQGAGRALAAADVETLNRWATAGLRPHLTVLLDVEPEDGRTRLTTGHDRIEAEPTSFHQRVREHFLALAERDPQHYLVLDARKQIDDLRQEIAARVEPLLEA